MNTFRSSLVMNAKWRDYTFTSTSSYDRISNFGTSDQDYSSLRGYGGAFETVGFSGADYWSQELRVASPRDGRLRGQAGFYTFEANPDTSSLAGNLVANPIPGPPDLPASLTPQDVDSGEERGRLRDAQFDVLENLTLTAEALCGRHDPQGGRSVFSKTGNTGFLPGSFHPVARS